MRTGPGIIYLFALLSCTPCREEAVQNFGQDLSNVLLQQKTGGPAYIFFVKDTAFYEYREKGKPEYFTDLDTLIRRESGHYQGKRKDLHLGAETINLDYINREDAKKNLQFHVACDKQIRRWNYYKNIDKYNLYGHNVDSLLEANATNLEFYTRLRDDWDKLLPLTSSLNQKDFDSALNNFKSTYSIK